MKKIHSITALLLAAVCIFGAAACNSSDNDESSSETVSEETSAEESSQSSKVSKEESSKQKETSKKESSKEEGPQIVDSSREILSDFTSLLASNKETVGWIDVPNTPIDYVVLKAEDDIIDMAYQKDPYYLYKDFYGNYERNGSIFMDYRSELGGKNMILHGHSGGYISMFTGLLNYKDLSFYKSAPVLTFNTLYEKNKWKVISVMRMDVSSSDSDSFRYLRGSFGSDYDFLEYVYQVRMRSIIDCPVTVNENDQIITLSTCDYLSFGDYRLVVVARKVREGEKSSVNVASAKDSANPLYPDSWYYYMGGSRPEVTSFQDALNKKKISWYDGKKKWTAKDDENLKKLLQDYKNKAEKRIRDSYKETDYTPAQINDINEVIDIYLPYVPIASDIARVNDLCNQCIAIIKTFTPEKKQAEEAEKERQTKLKTARAAAIMAIEDSLNGKTFTAENKKKVNELISTYKTKINECQDVDMIPVMRDNAIARIDKLKK